MQPAVVLGTGTGECIAACCAGIVSMEDSLLWLMEVGEGNGRQVGEFACQVTSHAAAIPWFTAGPQQSPALTSWFRNTASAALPLSDLQKENCSGYLAMGAAAAFEEFDKAAFSLSGPHLVSMRPNSDDTRALLEAAAGLYVLGCEFDFSALYGSRPRTVSLPTYPFERERYWFDAEENAALPRSLSSHASQSAPKTGSMSSPGRRDPFLNQLPLARNAAFQTCWKSSQHLGPPRLFCDVDEAGTWLQKICGGYARTILEQLGLKLSEGKEFTLDALLGELRIAPGRERILGRLLAILTEDGLLERKGEFYHCTGSHREGRSRLGTLRTERPLSGNRDRACHSEALCIGRTAAVLRGSL